MCNPAIAGLVISAIAAGASAYQADQNADAQSELLQDQADQASLEQGAAASAEAGERVRQARIEAAKRLVAAGDAGVSGNSINTDITKTFTSADIDIGNVAQQALYAGTSTALRGRAEALSINRPSAVSAGLQIADAGARGYSQGLEIDRARRGR